MEPSHVARSLLATPRLGISPYDILGDHRADDVVPPLAATETVASSPISDVAEPRTRASRSPEKYNPLSDRSRPRQHSFRDRSDTGHRWETPATGQAAKQSPAAPASQAEIDTEPMTANPLSHQDRPLTARSTASGALPSDTRRRFGFDTPPLRQYNPLYLRRAVFGPNSFGRAA